MLTFSQAALGAEIMIPTLEGEHRLKIPEATQSGTTFRIRGKGLQALQSSGKGDLFVKIRVQTPSRLTKRQRELYDAVRNSLGASEHELRPGAHTRTIEKGAAEILRKHGLEPGLATLVFHPIGLNVFDYASPEEAANGWTVQASTAMNFEVFYRDPEFGGIHLEDTVLVTDSGIEHFSKFPRDMIVIAN